jgi:hypothetical protein
MRSALVPHLPAALLCLASLSALACSSETSTDSAACRRYKAALLEESSDLAYTTPPVDGRYDAYRCPSAEEFVPQGEYTSLEACAEYLEGLNGGIPLGGSARSVCKIGVLIWADRAAQVSSDGVGSACTLRYVPPAEEAEGVFFETSSLASGQGSVCVGEGAPPSAEGYRTCRCDAAGADLPVCACPEGFLCELGALPVDGDGLRGGYCLRR